MNKATEEGVKQVIERFEDELLVLRGRHISIRYGENEKGEVLFKFASIDDARCRDAMNKLEEKYKKHLKMIEITETTRTYVVPN